MTALQEYQRLECTGLWRDGPEAQRREVIVAFGDATLVLSEVPSGRAITHWSLPAVVRLPGPGLPARYAPAPEADEELEIDDAAMVDAIAKVHHLIAARRPHPGRLRRALLGGALAAVAGMLVFWIPDALVRHTATSLPLAKRQEIGHAALADLARVTGTPCVSPEGQEALLQLQERLLGPEGEIFVVPNSIARSVALPGGIVVLGRTFVEGAEAPEVVAGEVLAADLGARMADPLVTMLRHAGLRATFALLTTGDLPQAAATGSGEALLGQAPPAMTQSSLVEAFATAGIAASPYAYALDPSGETVLTLIEADTVRGKTSVQPVLDDTDWVAFQGICTG